MKYLALIEFKGTGGKSCAGCDGIHTADTLGYHYCAFQNVGYSSAEELHSHCPLVPMTQADKYIRALRAACIHQPLRDLPNLADIDSERCTDCGKWVSWICPTSPTLECKYYGPHKQDWTRQFGTMNGKSYHDEDDCIYCGNPEERK